MISVRFVTVPVRMTQTNHAMVAAIADSRHQSVSEFMRDVVDNFCADQRGMARRAMDPTHYTERRADDYEEVG